jgi:hypothetical protein
MLCNSRQPFLDAARRLIEQGYDPATMLVMRHAGSSIDSLRAPLGVAACLTVDEHHGVFARWKPFSPSAVSPRIAPRATAAIPLQRLPDPPSSPRPAPALQNDEIC